MEDKWFLLTCLLKVVQSIHGVSWMEYMNDSDILEEIDQLISHDEVSWFFGAGSSFASGLPLMFDLTERVLVILDEKGVLIKDIEEVEAKAADFARQILGRLGENKTVEQLLDQIGDYLAMAHRADSNTADTGLGVFRNDQLSILRKNILSAIKQTVSFGYKHADNPGNCEIGTIEKPIISIDLHVEFFEALFGEVRAGRPGAKYVELFTTNYDTLFEDALSLKGIPYSDGFKGGAVGYWEPSNFSSNENAVRFSKLHGSVDWSIYEGKRIVRRRFSDQYPPTDADLLIYPQSSKYEFARREPYDTLFQRFRQHLAKPSGQVLCVCGYSFGDLHIDHEIETAMSHPDSDLTLVIFTKSPSKKLENWLTRSFGERIYILTEDSVYRGGEQYCKVTDGHSYDWWTFQGVVKKLKNAKSYAGAA